MNPGIKVQDEQWEEHISSKETFVEEVGFSEVFEVGEAEHYLNPGFRDEWTVREAADGSGIPQWSFCPLLWEGWWTLYSLSSMVFVSHPIILFKKTQVI